MNNKIDKTIKQLLKISALMSCDIFTSNLEGFCDKKMYQELNKAIKLLKKLTTVMDTFEIDYDYDYENQCDVSVNQIVYDLNSKAGNEFKEKIYPQIKFLIRQLDNVEYDSAKTLTTRYKNKNSTDQ